MHSIDNLYLKLQKIIKNAGELVEKLKREKYRVIRKSSKELVTEIDMAVQKYLEASIKDITKIPIFFEEDNIINHTELPSECFIIDPIDATHNFIAGLPFYNISVGYVKDNKVEFGLIYFPYSKNIYHAFKGKGAYRNDKKIHVSSNDSIEKSIVAYDNQFHLEKDAMNNYQKVVSKVFTTRILGSANCDACFVAEGVLDARIWNATKMFDIVAGSIIVKEAGGLVSDFNSKSIDLFHVKEVIMSSSSIHASVLDILSA